MTHRYPAMYSIPAPTTRCIRAAALAFTLIELLVVIGIIALLMGILLPVLGQARGAAQSAGCLAHLKQIATAFNTYALDSDDFLPGPNTSGYHLRSPGASARTRAAEPTMPDDWYSPLFGDALGLPQDRDARLRTIFNDEFRCPANSFTYDGIFDGALRTELAGWPSPASLQHNSYSAPFTLHYYQDSFAARLEGNQPFGRSMAGRERRALNLRPARYRFRLTDAGKPALKAAALDGTRYLQDGVMSFNIDSGSSFGSTFMNRSPAINASGPTGSPYKTASADARGADTDARTFTYRHPADSLNIAFLDGHAGNASIVESRRLEFYVPSGAAIGDQPFVLTDPNTDWQRGDVIP